MESHSRYDGHGKERSEATEKMNEGNLVGDLYSTLVSKALLPEFLY